MANNCNNTTNEAQRYVCVRCGNCCRWEGYVHLFASEIEQIAEFLQLSRDDFVALYTRLAPSRKNLALIENSDESCVFLTEDNRCLIQAVKPRQCREFPNDWDIPRLKEKCNAVDTQATP